MALGRSFKVDHWKYEIVMEIGNFEELILVTDESILIVNSKVTYR